MTTGFTFTSDFHQELEVETSRLLRRRFLWFSGVTGFLSMALVVARLTDELIRGSLPFLDLAQRGLFLVAPLATLAAFLWAKSRPVSRSTLLRASFWLIVLQGVGPMVHGLIYQYGIFDAITLIWFAHMMACVMLPWMPRQALRPTVPVLGLSVVTTLLFFQGTVGDRLLNSVTMLLSLIVAFTPGVLISWFRHTKRLELFRSRFIETRYGQMRRELADARSIHQGLFPAPVNTGPIRFQYHYEPMLQIGGDYIYARFAPATAGEPPPFDVLLIDVTGHGIAAALTVNRLFGEIERLYAEDPLAKPGDVLKALNRYVHLTLATHSIYATALCVRIDPARNQLEFASGGHPPAFVRGVDGTIDQLASTSFVLGVCAAPDFDPAPESRHFGPGDVLLAYTDGAIEARNDHGKYLGVVGLQRVVANAAAHSPGSCMSAIVGAVEEHRQGPARDDTIVLEVTRLLGYPPTASVGSGQVHANGAPAIGRAGGHVAAAAPV
ncbi:MAG: serine/threonine-protein phosphatase [Phycisphaerales bacterium]|nr:serine/threonine-protein phosphatase [Phycisphaerales bacterium]